MIISLKKPTFKPKFHLVRTKELINHGLSWVMAYFTLAQSVMNSAWMRSSYVSCSGIKFSWSCPFHIIGGLIPWSVSQLYKRSDQFFNSWKNKLKWKQPFPVRKSVNEGFSESVFPRNQRIQASQFLRKAVMRSPADQLRRMELGGWMPSVGTAQGQAVSSVSSQSFIEEQAGLYVCHSVQLFKAQRLLMLCHPSCPAPLISTLQAFEPHWPDTRKLS